MKNAFTRKIVTAAAALLVVLSLSGCSMYAPPEETPADPSAGNVVTAADVSATDVSGSDVSASDVVVLDDATLADNALNAYFAAMNSGDVDRLVELTAAPPMVSFLESIGTDVSYLSTSFRRTIDSMKAVSGGYNIVWDYTAAEASEDEMTAIRAEIDALSAGAGEKVEAARVYEVSLKAYAADMTVISGSDVSTADVISSVDVVSGSDAVQVLEESESTMNLYKYGGQWYVM